ncbi:MAG: septum formation initiator family protein [Thermoleophilia bacterium]|nr:septum formation initiator family protein [Thermoleophilia bacterium]
MYEDVFRHVPARNYRTAHDGRATVAIVALTTMTPTAPITRRPGTRPSGPEYSTGAGLDFQPGTQTGTRRQRLPASRTLFGDSKGLSWLFMIMLLLIGLLLIRPMMMSLLSYHRTAALLTERRGEVAQLSSRNVELRTTREWYRSDAFLAVRAREYGLVKPGETPFVIRELVHPELVAAYAATQLQNATGAHPNTGAAALAATSTRYAVTPDQTPQP